MHRTVCTIRNISLPRDRAGVCCARSALALFRADAGVLGARPPPRISRSCDWSDVLSSSLVSPGAPIFPPPLPHTHLCSLNHLRAGRRHVVPLSMSRGVPRTRQPLDGPSAVKPSGPESKHRGHYGATDVRKLPLVPLVFYMRVCVRDTRTRSHTQAQTHSRTYVLTRTRIY